jgi:hypothetical protein
LIDAAGNVITSTTDGSKHAADVHIANTTDLNVSVNNGSSLGVHAEDSAHVSGDSGVLSLVVRNDAGGTLAGSDGDYAPLQVNASGELRTVTSISSSVADGSPDTENPFKVGAHARTAGTALPTVTNGSKVDVTTDLYRRVYINDAPNVSLLAAAITVGTTAVALPASPLAGRTRLLIQNRGGQSIFVGGSSVTTSSGMEVTKGATMTLEAGPALAFYAISGSPGNDIRIIEIA